MQAPTPPRAREQAAAPAVSMTFPHHHPSPADGARARPSTSPALARAGAPFWGRPLALQGLAYPPLPSPLPPASAERCLQSPPSVLPPPHYPPHAPPQPQGGDKDRDGETMAKASDAPPSQVFTHAPTTLLTPRAGGRRSAQSV